MGTANRQGPPGGTAVDRVIAGASLLVGIAPATLVWATLLGLGVLRHGAPWAVAAVATSLVFAPAVAVGAVVPRHGARAAGMALALWSIGLWVGLPVYFAGERRQALATGLALVGGDAGWEQALAEHVSEEPTLSRPPAPEAAVLQEILAPRELPMDEDQIPLPFEGEGRRMSIPVTFEHDGIQVETWMLLDTGATYTTLPESVLAKLHLRPGPDAPSLRLHTANGERDAHVVLAERVWLGDLPIDGVAVATCDPCAGDEASGLLGLNVTGNYNLLIDSDVREVLFTRRSEDNRRLDVRPFVRVGASVSRYPAERVEVTVRVANEGPRRVEDAVVAVRCGPHSWLVDVGSARPGEEIEAVRRLPAHEPCDRYEVALHHATW